MLLEFYAASGDFTRRLTSVKANAKFSSPSAGPDDYFSVQTRTVMTTVEHWAADCVFIVEHVKCIASLPK